MNSAAAVYHGVVRGKTIELERATSFPDGQDVTVAIEPTTPGAGIKASAGSWAEAGPKLDEWLQQSIAPATPDVAWRHHKFFH